MIAVWRKVFVKVCHAPRRAFFPRSAVFFQIFVTHHPLRRIGENRSTAFPIVSGFLSWEPAPSTGRNTPTMTWSPFSGYLRGAGCAAAYSETAAPCLISRMVRAEIIFAPA